MSGYVKIYGSILGSSVWAEEPTTRIVWITMLALADAEGMVDASTSGLARFANVTIADCNRALKALTAPDLDSKSPEWGGRRVEKVEGGWLILNYLKYRELRSPKQIADAERQERFREKRRHEREAAAIAEKEKEGERDQSHGSHGVAATVDVAVDVAVDASPSSSPPSAEKPKIELPPVHLGKTPGELSLARELDSDADRLALTAICAVVPAPHQWVAEASVRLQGMHGKMMTPTQVGVALREFVGSGHHLTAPPSFKLFRRFLDNAANSEENVPRGTSAPTGSQNGVPRRPDDQPVSTGEAGAILVKIKAFSRRTETQGSGGVVFIRRAEVEELGAEVLAAYDTIGGADGVLKCDPSRWGLLVRDFANALTYQRQQKQEPAT